MTRLLTAIAILLTVLLLLLLLLLLLRLWRRWRDIAALAAWDVIKFLEGEAHFSAGSGATSQTS